jgi:hypothetical protein
VTFTHENFRITVEQHGHAKFVPFPREQRVLLRRRNLLSRAPGVTSGTRPSLGSGAVAGLSTGSTGSTPAIASRNPSTRRYRRTSVAASDPGYSTARSAAVRTRTDVGRFTKSPRVAATT